MAVEMNSTEEKIWKYLVEHKTPTSASKLAKYFILSNSRIYAIMRRFVAEGIVDVVPMGNNKFYRVKE